MGHAAATERRVGDWILERDDGSGMSCRHASDPELRGKIEVRRLSVFHRANVEREVAMLRACDHPAVPRVLDVDVDRAGRRVWRVVEAPWDRTLADRLLEGALPPEEACATFLRLARGVHHLHHRGFVHGGLATNRVGLGRDGSVYFTTLSSAWEASSAPAHVNAGEDVYAFGRMLHQALTGGEYGPLSVVVAEGESTVRRRAVRCDPGTGFRPWLRALVRKATEPDPALRDLDFDAISGDLEAGWRADTDPADRDTDPFPLPRLEAPRPRRGNTIPVVELDAAAPTPAVQRPTPPNGDPPRVPTWVRAAASWIWSDR